MNCEQYFLLYKSLQASAESVDFSNCCKTSENNNVAYNVIEVLSFAL